MNPLALGGIVQAVGQLADNLVTTDKEKLDAEIELRKLGIEERKVDAGLVQGQLEVNRAEAASASAVRPRRRIGSRSSASAGFGASQPGSPPPRTAASGRRRTGSGWVSGGGGANASSSTTTTL